jgi:hypothetical protein
LTGTDVERAAWFSPTYGSRVASRAISVRRTWTGHDELFSCLSISNDLKPTITRTGGGIEFCVGRDDTRNKRLYYRLIADARPALSGAEFDGDVFYRSGSEAAPAAVWATNFHELAVPELLSVRSETMVDSLNLRHNRCEIVTAAGPADAVDVKVRSGIEVAVRQRSALPSAATTRSASRH